MLLEGRRDDQSTYQAKEIESKDVKDAETNKLLRNRGKRRSNKHVGIVDVNTPMTVVSQQQERYAINVENLMTLLMYVEVVQRNLQENIRQENQSLEQKIITRTQILASNIYTQ